MLMNCGKWGGRAWLKVELVALLGFVLIQTSNSIVAQAPTAKLPRYDQRIDHPQPDDPLTSQGMGPTFGWGMAIGNVDDSTFDTNDDLVIASFFKDLPGGVDAGTSYAFAGPTLVPHAIDKLFPAAIADMGKMGNLNLVIADVVGLSGDPLDVPNRVFIPSWHREMDLSGCDGGAPDALVGAVDVFDLTLQQNAVLSITPPPNPDVSETMPCGAAGFGHWVDAADIDGDGVDDLIVGAPDSDAGEGRVYIFFGNASFLQPGGYTQRWLILRPPPAPAIGLRFPPQGQFGWSLSAADLDGDGMAELAVGRPEKPNGPGRVHVFLGSWLASQVWYLDTFEDVTPSPPLGVDVGLPGEYETLIDNSAAPFRPPMAGTGQTFAFGWIVDMKGGDLGRPFDAEDPEWAPGFDGRVDLLVHAEAAKGYGRNSQSIVDGGALFAFFNNSTVIGGESLLDESKPAKLMTPRVKDASGGPKYYPQDNARYGRGFAVADWKTAGGDPLRILLIGEPNRSLPNPAVPGSPLTLAGVVWALGLPLDPTFDPNDLVAQHQHVWGDEPLFEPAEGLPQNVEANLWDPGASDPQDGGRFGAWIIAGRYDPSFPEDQIVICSRERDVTVGGTSYEALGRVYTITLPSESP